MSRIFDPALVVTAAGGGTAAAVDLRTRRVPNAVSLGVAIAGVALAAAHLTGISVAQAAAGCAIGLLLMLPGHLIGATGAGDVKLLAAFGTVLGPMRTGTAFVYTALAGGALALAVALHRRRAHTTIARTLSLIRSRDGVRDIEGAREDNRFAYAPAIAIGALAAAIGL